MQNVPFLPVAFVLVMLVGFGPEFQAFKIFLNYIAITQCISSCAQRYVMGSTAAIERGLLGCCLTSSLPNLGPPSSALILLLSPFLAADSPKFMSWRFSGPRFCCFGEIRIKITSLRCLQAEFLSTLPCAQRLLSHIQVLLACVMDICPFNFCLCSIQPSLCFWVLTIFLYG